MTTAAARVPAQPNRYETRARTIKAAYLADYLLLRGADADVVHRLAPEQRRAVERAAGVKSPASDETWQIAAALVEHAQRRAHDPVPLDLPWR